MLQSARAYGQASPVRLRHHCYLFPISRLRGRGSRRWTRRERCGGCRWRWRCERGGRRQRCRCSERRWQCGGWWRLRCRIERGSCWRALTRRLSDCCGIVGHVVVVRRTFKLEKYMTCSRCHAFHRQRPLCTFTGPPASPAPGSAAAAAASGQQLGCRCVLSPLLQCQHLTSLCGMHAGLSQHGDVNEGS